VSPDKTQDSRFNLADLWAGMAAAAVVLPQAMAFGVGLLVPAGFSAASGALTGLIGAAALSLFSGLLGGTRGLISAPTGPVLVLLSGALVSLGATGLEGEALLTAMVLVMVATGVLQVLIGLSGGGRLIKFMPYTVVAGFMTGSAILMILSQTKPLSGQGFSEAWAAWRWLPAITAFITFACMHLIPKRLPMVPGTIAGLVCGTLAFHLLALAGPGAVPGGWVIGQLPDPKSIRIGFDIAALSSIPLTVILIPAATLAVLASVDTLLTSVIADVATGTRHDARRELIGQGLGQVVSGLFGGMAGAGTTGATVVAVRTGGRRWAGALGGGMFIMLVLFGGPLGSILPVSVLAGIILHVAVGMVERDIWAWLKRRRTLMDGGIALLVTTVTVAYDLMVAVAFGVGIAVIMFIRAQVKAPVIHRRSTATQHHSQRKRTEEQRALLDGAGHRIVIYEVRGNLFFATADRLYEELAPDLDGPHWVILHMRRVHQVDLTGIKILQQVAARLHKNGGQLIFCNVYSGAGMGHNVKRTLRKISPSMGKMKIKTFNGMDEALEYAEDALLEELGAPPVKLNERKSLAEMDLCRNMMAEEVTLLEGFFRPRSLKGGAVLFHKGDMGQELYIVARGEVDIMLPTTRHHYKRLARCGPGTMFGEVSFFSPGPRTADAVASGKTELLVLDRPDFERLAQAHPAVAIALLNALGVTQGYYLRWAAGEINRLAQW